MEHGAWSITADSWQKAEVRRSEVRDQRSGVKLISDLRLVSSVIDDLNGLNHLKALMNQLDLPSVAPQGKIVIPGFEPER
jgi:hypothetical protein